MRTRQELFPAMGATAHVIIVGGDAGLLDTAIERIAQLEARWSRFLPDSEISRHNAWLAGLGPEPLRSADTDLLLERATAGFEVTHGRFDPYRLGDVVRAGYRLSRTSGPEAPDDHAEAPVLGFDPGGIGKGLAADIVSEELLAAGASGALVGIGGDLRVRGEAPDGGPWIIEIEDPQSDTPLTRVAVTDGGVATSSQLKRRWVEPDGTIRHHLIDPATATSAHSPVLAATVVAAEAWQAEVLAKVAFLDAFGATALATDAGLELIESLGAAALVRTDSLTSTTSRWAQYEVTPAEREGVLS